MEINKLVKGILCYFVDTSIIDVDNNSLTPHLKICSSHQLSDAHLEVGEKARVIHSIILDSFTLSSSTVISKYPFCSTTLHDLSILILT